MGPRGMGASTPADPLEVVSARPACRHSGFILKLRSLQARLGGSTYGSPMSRVPRLSAATPGPALA
jgi:hypothetical protein